MTIPIFQKHDRIAFRESPEVEGKKEDAAAVQQAWRPATLADLLKSGTPARGVAMPSAPPAVAATEPTATPAPVEPTATPVPTAPSTPASETPTKPAGG